MAARELACDAPAGEMVGARSGGAGCVVAMLLLLSHSIGETSLSPLAINAGGQRKTMLRDAIRGGARGDAGCRVLQLRGGFDDGFRQVGVH